MANLSDRAGAPTFNALIDTPDTKVADNYVKVNAGGTDLEYDDLSSKQDTLTGATSNVVATDLTVDRAMITNGSGKVAVSPVTAAELAFVDGVTSNIQTVNIINH